MCLQQFTFTRWTMKAKLSGIDTRIKIETSSLSSFFYDSKLRRMHFSIRYIQFSHTHGRISSYFFFRHENFLFNTTWDSNMDEWEDDEEINLFFISCNFSYAFAHLLCRKCGTLEYENWKIPFHVAMRFLFYFTYNRSKVSCMRAGTVKMMRTMTKETRKKKLLPCREGEEEEEHFWVVESEKSDESSSSRGQWLKLRNVK